MKNIFKHKRKTDDEKCTQEYVSQMTNKIKGCYYSINGEVPSSSITVDIANKMPREILYLASKWGWNDTEVRDSVYKFIRDEYD